MINENEIKSIINKLIENADDFRFLKFSQVNFRHEFGLHGEIITPIGMAFMDYNQFNKVEEKLRNAYFGLIKPTLEKPLLIIKHRERTIFLKTFNSKKDRAIFFVGVTQEEDGEFSLVSGHRKTINNIKNKLKEGNIIYQTDSFKPQSHLGNTQPKPPYYVSLTMGIDFSFAKIQKKDMACQVLSGINLQNVRARIYAFKHIISLYPNYVGFLRNGTLPDEEAVKTDFEILENEYFGKADADNKTPLTFTELCSYNTWFYLHPEKIAGTEHLTTSREFPVTIKGTKDDIINTIKAGIKANPDKEKRIRIAKVKAAAKLKLLEIMNLGNIPTEDFGTIYTEFKDRLKEAIKHLKKVQEGECINALYRDDIGYIDIVWGKNDPKTNKGFGLKHIVEKHGEEIEQLGFKVEDFIPIVVQFAEFNKKASKNDRLAFESNMFRFVVELHYRGKKKQWLLTAFDLRKKLKK